MPVKWILQIQLVIPITSTLRTGNPLKILNKIFVKYTKNFGLAQQQLINVKLVGLHLLEKKIFKLQIFVAVQ